MCRGTSPGQADPAGALHCASRRRVSAAQPRATWVYVSWPVGLHNSGDAAALLAPGLLAGHRAGTGKSDPRPLGRSLSSSNLRLGPWWARPHKTHNNDQANDDLDHWQNLNQHTDWESRLRISAGKAIAAAAAVTFTLKHTVPRAVMRIAFACSHATRPPPFARSRLLREPSVQNVRILWYPIVNDASTGTAAPRN